MKCICGFIPVTSGSITVRNKVISKKNTPENIGLIIETPGFLPNYSGYRNLKFLADISGKANKNAIIRSIESVGLDPHSKKHVGKYSLGMRQRLGLAQAIMEDPDLLILDEPMNGLDKDGERLSAQAERTRKNNAYCLAFGRRYRNSLRYGMRNG